MQVEIIQAGRILRSLHHNGQNFIEAPPRGEYEIRMTNNHAVTRMAVLSIDGINVVNGENAGYDGPGYVLGPWQSITVKGWHRTNSEVAAFTFEANDKSYANQTGRGKKNTAVIGVAVFNEKPKPKPQPQIVPPIIIREEHHHHHPARPWNPSPWWSQTVSDNTRRLNHAMDSMTYDSAGAVSNSMGDDGMAQVYCAVAAHDGSEPVASTVAASFTPESSPTKASKKKAAKRGSDATKKRGTSRRRISKEAVELGTGYGSRTTMHTSTVDFERVSDTPNLVIELRYAVTAKLREWGVPVKQMVSAPVGYDAPSAFPESAGVPAPPGWRG